MHTLLKSLAILLAALWLAFHIIAYASADSPVPQPIGCIITEVVNDGDYATAYCEWSDTMFYYIRSINPVCSDIATPGWLTRKEVNQNYQACFYEYRQLKEARSYATTPNE